MSGWRAGSRPVPIAVALIAGMVLAAASQRPAAAQAIQSTPLPPPPGTTRPLAPEPLPQAPAPPVVPGQTLPAVPPPAGTGQAQPDQGQGQAQGQDQGQPGTPAGPNGTAPVQPVQPDWLPRTGFELRGLDKVTTQSTTLTGKVGETVTFGTLSIVVRHCVVRPPDRPKGAAAYLDITDTAPQADPATAFHGWMFSNYPSLAMLHHPTYDITLAGCTP